MNVHALAPLKYKKYVVISFIYRIYRACSSWSHFHEGIIEAKEILKQNQYPLDFVEPIINSTLKSILGFSKDDINSSINSEDSGSDITRNELSLDTNACIYQFE